MLYYWYGLHEFCDWLRTSSDGIFIPHMKKDKRSSIHVQLAMFHSPFIAEGLQEAKLSYFLMTQIIGNMLAKAICIA